MRPPPFLRNFFRRPIFAILLSGCLTLPCATQTPAQTTTQEWQAAAVQKYPDLAVAGSELNGRFVDACKERRVATPAFFGNPKWPLLLADELMKSQSAPFTAATPAAETSPTPPPVAAKEPAEGVITEYEAKNIPSAAGLESASFRWWAPANVQVRGVLVLIPGRGGDGRGMASDKDWQTLATETGFGILACCLKNPEDNPFTYQGDPNGSISNLIDETVDAVLVENGQQIKNPPLAFWGHSAGANVTELYAFRHANRVIGAVLTRGTRGPGEHSPTKDDVPILILVGKNDKPEWVDSALKCYEKGKVAHALWTLALHPNQGHELGDTLPLALAHLRAAIQLRLPLGNTTAKPKKLSESSGWLGDPTTYEIASYVQYKNKKKDAIWLLDETTAQAWKKHLSGS